MRLMPVRKAEERVDGAADRLRDLRQPPCHGVVVRRFHKKDGGARDAEAACELGLRDPGLFAQFFDFFRVDTSVSLC